MPLSFFSPPAESLQPQRQPLLLPHRRKALRRVPPEKGLPPVGLSDDAFIRAKTPMTKREIRAQVISSLRLAPDSVVWDVGAGTGSVTVECARQCPLGQVYAVERDEDALSLIRQNIARFHLQNATVVPGSAPDGFFTFLMRV